MDRVKTTVAKRIPWLARSIPSAPNPSRGSDSKRPRITISLLTFSGFESCQNLVAEICAFLKDRLELDVTIIVRNNNPRLDSSDFDKFWQRARIDHPNIALSLYNNGLNIGFGEGHNANFKAKASDYFLILNDDIRLQHMRWLDEAMQMMGADSSLALVGAKQNPSSVTSLFANGVHPNAGQLWPLRYAEASILIARSTHFASVGHFDSGYEWAMCEDSDLSFRIQAHGYKIAWIDIPHEHFRSTSFNVLPSQTKSAILEHNRSVLLSRWNQAFATGIIGRYHVYDLWSDGIGDVFCGLVHLRCYLDSLPIDQQSSVVINCSQLGLAARLFPNHVKLTSISNLDDLRAHFATDGISSLNSLRPLNYGLPFNIHGVICAALGIEVANLAQTGEVIARYFPRPVSESRTLDANGPYCVVHVESERRDHDGRGPSPVVIAHMLAAAGRAFSHIVVVGKQRSVTPDLMGGSGRVTDLQDRLSMEDLIGVIQTADAFVGIDSFPSNVAQLAGVKSALFFGSIHPSFRVRSESSAWPIVADLPCLGCYHGALEPSIPFCMRRDIACTKDVSEEAVTAAVTGCRDLEAYDWRTLETRSVELQRKFLTKMFFHPASPKQFFQGKISNERTSNLVYQMIDSVMNVVSQHLPREADRLHRELAVAQAESLNKDIRIQKMISLIGELRARR